MWLDCEYILKADHTRFTGSVNVRYGRQSRVKEDSKVFGLSNWKNEIARIPGGSDSKASAYNAGDLGSVPGSGRCPGEGNGNPL